MSLADTTRAMNAENLAREELRDAIIKMNCDREFIRKLREKIVSAVEMRDRLQRQLEDSESKYRTILDKFLNLLGQTSWLDESIGAFTPSPPEYWQELGEFFDVPAKPE